MTAARLSPLNRRNDLIGSGEQGVRLYFLCVRLGSRYSGSVQCEVILSYSFHVNMRYKA